MRETDPESQFRVKQVCWTIRRGGRCKRLPRPHPPEELIEVGEEKSSTRRAPTMAQPVVQEGREAGEIVVGRPF
jgi:hypothetical protein